jgi:hypothetical protein
LVADYTKSSLEKSPLKVIILIAHSDSEELAITAQGTIMENHLPTIGDRVQKLCKVCNEVRGHIVASVNKSGQIVSVRCPQCDSRSRFKKGEHLDLIGAAPEGAPYNWAITYRKGQTMMHPTFGMGEVTAVVDVGKIDVLFSDRVRRLVHTKA